MNDDFACIELALDLENTLSLLERLILDRSTRRKYLTLNSNDYDNICKAKNRRNPLQIYQILKIHQIMENNLEIQQKGQVLGEKKIQLYRKHQLKKQVILFMPMEIFQWTRVTVMKRHWAVRNGHSLTKLTGKEVQIYLILNQRNSRERRKIK